MAKGGLVIIALGGHGHIPNLDPSVVTTSDESAVPKGDAPDVASVAP